MAPFFSIIIPLYNKEKYILNTIKSVLNQSYQNFEIIIINDGSTDDSLNIVNQIQNDKISVFSQNNKGLSASRNKGISIAKGELIALLDADDIWLQDYLQTIKSLHDKFDGASIYGTDYYEERNGKSLRTNKNISAELDGKSFMVNDFFKANFNQLIFSQSSIAFKKLDLGESPFNETITYGEDLDFYLKYGYEFKVALCNQPLIKVNFLVEDQISTSLMSNKKILDLNYYQKKYKNHPSALKYIDIQRYKFAMKYLLEKNEEKRLAIIKPINYENLTKRQKFLLKSPRVIIILIKRIKSVLLERGIRVTTFRTLN